MKNYSIQDKYNDNKVWLVKVYAKGQVFYNQEINGVKLNSKFTATTKEWINQMLDIDLNDLISDEDQQGLLDNEEPVEYIGVGCESVIIDNSYWEDQRAVDDDNKAIDSEIQSMLDENDDDDLIF